MEENADQNAFVAYTEVEILPLSYLQERAKQKPPGYYEDMLQHGVVEGENLKIHRDELAKLFTKYNKMSVPRIRNPNLKPQEHRAFSSSENESPSVIQMTKNFASAMVDAAKTGFRKVTQEQHDQRMAVCNSCQFWDGKARMGMGKCNKCGCTGAKQWLASSRCPIGLWESVS